MAIGPDSKTSFLALSRFGYGARGGSDDLARTASDPRGRLKAELQQPDLVKIDRQGLSTSKEALQALFEQRQIIAQARQSKQAEGQDAPAAKGKRKQEMASQEEMAAKPKEDMAAGKEAMAAQSGTQQSAEQAKAKREGPPLQQRIFRSEALALFRKVTSAETGFTERLVQFWSNHFCVSATKGGGVRVLAGVFAREAIRPHVLGRFGDMLRAVAQHPAMLIYLDNARSFGPDSMAGQNRNRGLNENLAREILELHTLGVDGGYTQADVTSLARIITGWTFPGRDGRIGEPGQFMFFPRGHEPGDHTLLGKVYRAGGIEQGEAALGDLAQHPSTARHIARKFASHFIADDPPEALTHKLEEVFKSTHGDLKALTLALLDADEAWTTPAAKIRSPFEFMMASLRAVGRVPEEPAPVLGALVAMGMPLWQPAGPNGWPDTVSAWATPKGMKSRLDLAETMAGRVKQSMHPTALLDAVAGEAASAETRQAVSRAESSQQALALLLMSPEFQWR